MKEIMFSLLACFLIVHSNAQQSEVFAPGGTAINGYDAVAFFKEAKPVKGSDKYSYQYKGATWLFSNQEDREAFINMPEKYVPQYGGYCAYGTSQGHKATTQPETWTIVNDKLYFNYDNQVKQMWEKDQAHLIEVADQKWPAVKLSKE
jgi:YHS domain-containing protein